MSPIESLKHTLRALPFEIDVSVTNVEFETLNALIEIDRGNAYNVWKNSGLKHYPTVLRALKKLKIKGLVSVLEKAGERGERFYVPTFLGTLIPPLVKQDKKKIFALIANRSSRFKELVGSEIEETSVYSWAVDAIRKLAKNTKTGGPQNLNQILEDVIFGDLGAFMVDILNERENENELSLMLNELKQLATVRWVKNLIAIHLNEMLNDAKKDQQNLEKFKRELLD